MTEKAVSLKVANSSFFQEEVTGESNAFELSRKAAEMIFLSISLCMFPVANRNAYICIQNLFTEAKLY